MMEMMKKRIAILVLLLLINFPVISALELSNVQAQSITENSALIIWQTDEKADSFVNYGLEKENLRSVGDGNEIIDHKFLLSGLTSDTTYYYSVESNDIVDNQEGELYSFTTLPPDTTIPELNAEIPTAIQGGRLNLAGTTEIGAEISLFINNLLLQTITADDGSFEFQGILLQANQVNAVRLDVVDQAGNPNSLSGTIFADTEKPTIKLPEIPKYIDGNSFVLKAPVSEGVSVEIFVNNRSVWKDEEVSEIDKNLALQEGKNEVKIVLMDGAGWETIGEFAIISDTRPPQVSFELEKGLEYYEGRAETNINGKTEPGAAVYLYVFRGFGDEYKANFKRALAKQTADEEGEFTFKDISFPPSPFDMSLKELAPREVPSGLQEVVVSPLSQLSEEQRKSYKVYMIAEDKSGKSGYAQKTVNINSCFSADQAFDVTLIPQFQAPFKLNPGLMEEGRESIQSVFNITYRGGAVAPINPATNRPEEAYKISTVRFQKACTQSMLDEDEFKYGCQLMPSSFREQSNADHTSYYVTANLNRADEFIDKEDNVWDDFQKRQLKMPLKVTINYQERNVEGAWDQRKTQTFCYDLGYFVDIPIESADMIPDFLADEGVDALNWTIEQIEMLKPYLETAMLVTGISCIGSFLVKMIARFYRNFMSNFEPWLTRLKSDDERCPGVSGQNGLYLDDTINHWQNELTGHPDLKDQSKLPEDLDKKSLSKKCPSTATAWNVESYVDLAYRYTCDRFLCRSVPAGWTQEVSEEKIKEVVAEQKMCAASSGSCSFLDEIENCQEKIDASPAKKLDADNLIKRKGRTFSCYLNRENGLFYTVDRAPKLEEDRNIWLLKPENVINKIGTLTQPDLLAYQPPGTEQICVAKDLSCESQCKRKSGYQAVTGGYNFEDGVLLPSGSQKGSCYKEVQEGESIVLKDANNRLLEGERVAADYTKDCFVDKNTGDKFQCVCEPSKKETSTQLKGAREAVKKVGEHEEEWQYQQDRVFAESKGTVGTHYSKLRYYSGRDFSGAFGANYGLDNFLSKDFKTTEVNPHTQLLGTFQSMCIPGIYARLQLLESILIGLRNCIIEAKYTGFQDAGMCKTIFSQYVCGLIYKGISYLASDCSPISFSDLGKGETVGGVEAFFASGTKAIPKTLDSSISEIKEDYGNAQLDQFFASGSQGFAESLCLAAFGYDFPIDMDFIMDTAYAFPTATNVIFPIADRELSTFDPLKGTAVFNYHLGGTILPGCKIRSYRTTLKCIGPNDLGTDIDCAQQKCDCMDISEDASAFESQKTYVVQGGVGTGLSKGQMFDMPIPSPQKVSSAYRYDHVVLELNLAQGEDPEQCFDKEYRTSNGGMFYFPIRDISPPTVVACQASLANGKFSCPQLTDFFASGGSYFEHPFVRCFDRRKDEYVRCDQANVFLDNDPIVIKPQLNLGKSKACLKIEGDGINMPPQPLPEGLTGSYTPAITIGSVSQSMISGGSVGTIVPANGNDPGCGGHTNKELEVLNKPSDPSNLKPRDIRFNYERQGDKYKMAVATDGVSLETGGYNLKGGVVSGSSGNIFLSADDLNSLVFEFKGFRFTKVLGLPTPETDNTGQCVYQARFPRLGASGGSGSLSITMKLLQPVGDDCYLAETPIPASSLGLNLHTENIRIQSEPVEETYAQGLEQDFLNGNYDLVIAKAEGVVKQNKRSLADARALFYWIGSFVMQNNLTEHKNSISSLLNTFFNRGYGDEVKSTGEYQKIEVYLKEVDYKVKGAESE